jgi:outer membrane protein OmpA-like peptidoglycan-associated protein
MSNFSFRPNTALIFSLFSLLATVSFSQKAGLEVIRCEAIDRTQPLKNVAVDATGRRWAANSKGVFQIKANDLSTPLTIAPGMRNVLSIHGGNADFAWSEAKFKEEVKTPCSVTAAWYDSKNKVLWLGTDEAGLFQFSTEPDFKMVQQYLPVNSKLKSNNITHLFQDATGRLWVGNDKGIMYGSPGRWKSDLNGFAVQRVREYNTVIYVLADGFISKAPGGEKWSDLALQEKTIEGEIKDFDIDATGKMWIVSGHLTRFDMIASTYDEFSGPEYYTSQYGNSIAIDFEGGVWVGTQDKGLFNVDKASKMVLNAYVEKPISCEGTGKDAVLMAKVTGGDEPYTYVWSAGLSGESPKDVGAGVYTVTVTDNKGKTRTADVNVPDSRLKLKVRQKKPASGPGMADGSAEVDIATNASGITVVWDNGEAKVVATKLPAGEHKVTVTDPKGCVMTLSVTITELGQPLQLTLGAESPIKCTGEKAPLSAKPQGGKPPYQYTWSNPALTGEKPSAASGTYTVTVTDATGSSKTATFNLTQPDPISINVLVQSPPSAGGADGKALAQAKGGTGVYTFAWDNGESSYSASRLTEGMHNIKATDVNGCTTSAPFEMKAKVDALSVIIREARPIKCAGGKTNLTVAAVGGKMPYKDYKWQPSIPSMAEGVGVGEYTVTATDALGTTATASIKILEPQELVASAIAQSATSPGIDDGKALVTIKGGTGAMFFKWDNDEITAATLRLSAGKHTVTVTDENGCTATATVTITEGVLPLSLAINEVKKIKCAGEKASLEVQVTGGKGPYKYTWSNPAIVGGRPDVAAGEYVVTMTDMAGSTKTASISITEPSTPAISLEGVAPASAGNNDGKASARVKGGTAPYSYKWSNGESLPQAVRLSPGTQGVTVTDANGCSTNATLILTEDVLPLNAAITAEASIKCVGDKTGLLVQVSGGKAPYKFSWSSPALSGDKPAGVAAGDYQLTVTDALGASATSNISVKQPTAVSASITPVSPASTGNSDGKATAKASGGTGPYTYKWSNGETAAEALKLAPGNQTIIVTDANGCTATASISITENVLPLSAAITAESTIKCDGGKIALSVEISGGKKPYKYNWSNPALTGDKPAGIAAGDYQLTITDALGTSATTSISVKQPTAVSASITPVSPASTGNSDGKATAKVSGGTSPYTYKWSNGETAAEALKLAPGNQSLTVTDANGCSANASIAITENILPLNASITATSKIKCAGDKISVGVEVSGGKKPYSFKWNNPALTDGKPPTIVAGDYVVTVTDAAGGSTTASISIKQPQPVSLSVETKAPASTGKSDGQAIATPSGGTGPFLFPRSSGESGNTALKLAPGTQAVTATDANGCAATATTNVTENILAMTMTLTEKASIKCAGDKAALAVKVAGGKSPYTYTWNNPALKDAELTDLGPGEYAVTVSDVLGTTKTAAVTLSAPTAITIELIRNIGASSSSANDGKAQINVKGGTPEYKIVWDTRQTGFAVSKLPQGNHSVQVTDANGCTQKLDFVTERRLFPELTGKLEDGQTIRMRLLNFDNDSSVLKSDALPMLDELFDFMTDQSWVVIEVAGHTNNLPSDAFADQLSTARAKSVATYLFDKGIDPSRVVYKGYGKRLPLVPNTSPEGRRTNQRVEIKLLKVRE